MLLLIIFVIKSYQLNNPYSLLTSYTAAVTFAIQTAKLPVSFIVFECVDAIFTIGPIASKVVHFCLVVLEVRKDVLRWHIVEVVAFEVGLSEGKVISCRVGVSLGMGYGQIA